MPKHAHGQALTLGLFLVFAVAAVMYFMFNSGRAIDEKLRITNTADIIALSVATLEARALNYDAYANRAIVANQIAIAQAVSLVSWLHYYQSGVENVGALARVASSWLYYPDEYPKLAQLLAVLGGSSALGAGSAGALHATIHALDLTLASVITAHNTASLALSGSQAVMHLSLGSGGAQEAFANELAREIDPAFRVELNPATHQFASFTRTYEKRPGGRDERGRLADVVLRSRDTFTRERKWSIDGPDIPFLQRNVELKRRGGTELIGYDEWRALDTLEHEGQRLRKGRWRWRRTSIAGGGAHAANDDGDDSSGTAVARADHGDTYRDNPVTTKRYAVPSMVDLDALGARYSGLPASRELADLSSTARYTTGVTLRIAKARRALRTSGGTSVVQPEGRLQQFEANPPGAEMAALSRAEVFFERAVARSDHRAELPSLYSPYWQSRLTNVTAADRAWAARRQEGIVLP